ncbi:hypothetical protein GJ744_009142 [Endocarpon pusillum]|uniref:Uncharacterized protein n=1 Tax=Endocarpon pusillum TaxID=364733 RepID=A0A8H7AGB8_9EURO|nr:hypothetical protein GJ744_009142 [Endocarpon pusillum]
MSQPDVMDLYIVHRRMQTGDKLWMFGMRSRKHNKGTLVYVSDRITNGPVTIPWESLSDCSVAFAELISTVAAARMGLAIRLLKDVEADNNKAFIVKGLTSLNTNKLVHDDEWSNWMCRMMQEVSPRIAHMWKVADVVHSTLTSSGGGSTPSEPADPQLGALSMDSLPTVDEITAEIAAANLTQRDIPKLRQFRDGLVARGYSPADVLIYRKEASASDEPGAPSSAPGPLIVHHRKIGPATGFPIPSTRDVNATTTGSSARHRPAADVNATISSASCQSIADGLLAGLRAAGLARTSQPSATDSPTSHRSAITIPVARPRAANILAGDRPPVSSPALHVPAGASPSTIPATPPSTIPATPPSTIPATPPSTILATPRYVAADTLFVSIPGPPLPAAGTSSSSTATPQPTAQVAASRRPRPSQLAQRAPIGRAAEKHMGAKGIPARGASSKALSAARSKSTIGPPLPHTFAAEVWACMPPAKVQRTLPSTEEESDPRNLNPESSSSSQTSSSSARGTDYSSASSGGDRSSPSTSGDYSSSLAPKNPPSWQQQATSFSSSSSRRASPSAATPPATATASKQPGRKTRR